PSLGLFLSIRQGLARPTSRRGGLSSGLSPDNQVGQFPQRSRPRAERFERRLGALPFSFGHAFRFVQAVNRRKGDLLLLSVLTGPPPPRRVRSRNVQNALNRRERNPYVLAIHR